MSRSLGDHGVAEVGVTAEPEMVTNTITANDKVGPPSSEWPLLAGRHPVTTGCSDRLGRPRGCSAKRNREKEEAQRLRPRREAVSPGARPQQTSPASPRIGRPSPTLHALIQVVILASDGVWEFITSEEAVAMCQSKHPNATAATKLLIRESNARWKVLIPLPSSSSRRR